MFTVIINSLPRISINRLNTIFVKLVTKKTEFSIRLASNSNNANNGIILNA